MDKPAWFNWLLLIVGVLYLLADLQVFDQWATLSWYTVAFILFGLLGVSAE